MKKILLLIFITITIPSCIKKGCYVCKTEILTNGNKNGYGNETIYCDKTIDQIKKIEKDASYFYSKNGTSIETITKCK